MHERYKEIQPIFQSQEQKWYICPLVMTLLRIHPVNHLY